MKFKIINVEWIKSKANWSYGTRWNPGRFYKYSEVGWHIVSTEPTKLEITFASETGEVKFDFYDKLLKATGWKKLSKKRVDEMIDKLIGKVFEASNEKELYQMA